MISNFQRQKAIQEALGRIVCDQAFTMLNHLSDQTIYWAHLAYSIWPERVREKCKTDKSLAIAHDLEALYVERPASAKKRGRAKKAAVEDDEAGSEE